MYLIFLDESGYSRNWKSDIGDQPYFVMSGICVLADNYRTGCEKVREEIETLDIPHKSKPLGIGFEIKAKDIARGQGWWADHNDERNLVRESFLSFPKENDGSAFVVVINKQRHFGQYSNPEDPIFLALEFIFERFEHFLRGKRQLGVCIYDQTKALDDDLQEFSSKLIEFGTQFDEHELKMKNIMELYFGRSENSVGLQVADFFARMAYQYHKDDEPSPCGWWDTLCESLHSVGDNREGSGYKTFP